MNNFLKKYEFVYDTIVQECRDQVAEFDRLIHKTNILDYGCGQGEATLRFANEMSDCQVTGVDLHDAFKGVFESASKALGKEVPPPHNLEYVQIGGGQNDGSEFAISRYGDELVERSIFKKDYYDFCFSWCVFEHINQNLLKDILIELRNSLKSEGIFYLKINPLYYSSRGAHIYGVIDEPWSHLKYQNDVLEHMFIKAAEDKGIGQKDLIWHQYLTLNKLTADNLKRLLLEVGFKVLHEHRLYEGSPPIELTSTFSQEVLTNKDVVFILSK